MPTRCLSPLLRSHENLYRRRARADDAVAWILALCPREAIVVLLLPWAIGVALGRPAPARWLSACVPLLVIREVRRECESLIIGHASLFPSRLDFAGCRATRGPREPARSSRLWNSDRVSISGRESFLLPCAIPLEPLLTECSYLKDQGVYRASERAGAT